MKKLIKLLTSLTLVLSIPTNVVGCLREKSRSIIPSESNLIPAESNLIPAESNLIPAADIFAPLTPSVKWTFSNDELQAYTIKVLNYYFSDPKHRILKSDKKILISDIVKSTFNQKLINTNNGLSDDISFNLDLKDIFKYIINKDNFASANIVGEFDVNIKTPSEFNWKPGFKPYIKYFLIPFKPVISNNNNMTKNALLGHANVKSSDFTLILNETSWILFSKQASLGTANEFLKRNKIQNSNIALTNAQWKKIFDDNKFINPIMKGISDYWAIVHIVNNKVTYTNMRAYFISHWFPQYKDCPSMPQLAYKDQNKNASIYTNQELLMKLNDLYNYDHTSNSNWNVKYISNYLEENSLAKNNNIDYATIAQCLMNLVAKNNLVLINYINTVQVNGYEGILLNFDNNNKYLSSEINANHLS